jgi:hypothetical protein
MRNQIAAALLALSLAFVVWVGPALADGITQQGTLRVRFDGELAPKRLPRVGLAPVAVSLSGAISTTDHATPPQLQRITIAINRHGRLDTTGLPRCRYRQIQPASSTQARRGCAGSLLGTGHFRANVALPDQSPYPSNGRVLAFNGVLHGKPVVYAHIFGTKPVPISRLVVFHIRRIDRESNYRISLTAQLPPVAAAWGYVSGFSLTLKRTFHYHGRVHSYLSAGCPAPEGIDVAIYPFAKAAFAFNDGRTLRSSLTRTCRARH